MPLTPGTKIGSYDVVAPLGAGGMGEVYRALDPRLGRDVAIKLLPDHFAADPERLARFEREARLLASLSHPNIAILHGLETDAGRRFIVMEFVDGDSLAQRLQAGAMPVDEALDVARQVATALEAAHEGGVVHRDLKPGNVMLTPAGIAKVLDFGLAKGSTGSPSDISLSASPTMTYAATTTGTILGTAAYMSPEQARGKAVDRRTDIWSFGCVLYECLTGRQAFEGETVSDIIAAILKERIDWDALPADTPPRVRELLHRCLERDPRQRLRDIGEARLVLEQPRAAGAQVAAAPPALAPGRGGLPVALALGGAFALALVAAIGAWSLKPAPPAPPTWSDLVPPAGMRFVSQMSGGHAVLSPDGQRFATVVADSANVRRVLVRDFGSAAASIVAGTEGAIYPFWSPNGRSIGFFRDGKLIRYDLDGGALTTLAPALEGRGGAWSRDNVIVFAPTSTSGLNAVSAAGGDVRVLVPDSLRKNYRFPHFLPDGRHFVVASLDSSGASRLEVLSLEGGEPRPLPLGNVSGNAYFADGLLYFWQDDALRARRFDPRGMKLTGEAVTVASQVANARLRGRADFAVAAGCVVYRHGVAESVDQLVVRDRGGKVVSRVENRSGLMDLDLAPSDRAVAWSQTEMGSGKTDVWTHDFDRQTTVRLTFSGTADDPVWSPDGSRIAWQGPGGIVLKGASGAGSETMAYPTTNDVSPSQWSPDGRTILFAGPGERRLSDALWSLDLETGAARELLSAETGNARFAQLSADGRWLAYASNESGRSEVYVQDHPGLRGRWQISARSGIAPRWRRDGRELYYLDYDGKVVAVSVTARDSSLTLGNPQVLFETAMGPKAANRTYSWDVDAQGTRFHTVEPMRREEDRQPLVMVRRWRPGR